MRNKKPFWLVFILGLLVGVKAQAAEEGIGIALPAAAVSVSGGGEAPSALAFRVVREENATFATVLASAPFNYTTRTLDSPPRYVVDMAGLVVSPEQVQSVEVNSDAVRVIRFLQAEQGTGRARLVVELNQAAECTTFTNANGTGLLVRVEEGEEALASAGVEATGSVVPMARAEMVAWLPEGESLAAVSPAYSDYGPQPSGEAPQAISVAPEIPRATEAPLPALSEALVSSAAASAIVPAVVEGPKVTSLAPEGASWRPVASAASERPVLVAMAPARVPSRAVVRVALVEEGPGTSSAAPVTSPGHVSVDFVDTSLADVFKSLAFQSGRDILVHQGVTGTVTVKLHDVPLEQAVDLIASMYNLSVRRVADVYLIGLRAAEAPGPTAQRSELYHLKGISPESALGILGLVPGVKAMAIKEQGALLLTGSEADLTLALDLLAKVDQAAAPTADGEVVRLVTLRNASPEAVAGAIRGALPRVAVSVESELKAITVRGSAADVAAAEQMIRELDRDLGVLPVPGVTTTAIKVQHVSVATLAAKLEQLLPAAKVTYDEALEAIFLSGTPEDIQAALTITKVIDVPPPTAGPAADAGREVIIRDLEYASPQEAKSLLEGAAPGKISVTFAAVAAAGGVPMPVSDRIVITFPKGMFGIVKQLLESVDVRPKEVVIEALITDMSRQLSKDLGFAWDFGGTVGIRIIAPANPEGIGFPGWSRGALTITSLLSAIEGDTSSKLLARPSIRAMDSHEASILIGEKILFQVATVSAGTVMYTIKEERVGIGLTITPRITSDGHVLATVHPEVSTVTGFNPQGYPNIATREADLPVILRDGETLVIGGLIREEEIANISKVPILSGIPILGELFTRRTKMTRPSEVLIFLTPHIVDGGEGL